MAITSGDSATQLALTNAVTSLTEAIAAGDGKTQQDLSTAVRH